MTSERSARTASSEADLLRAVLAEVSGGPLRRIHIFVYINVSEVIGSQLRRYIYVHIYVSARVPAHFLASETH